MATINKNTYFIVKDKHGNDYLCPLNVVKLPGTVITQKTSAEKKSGLVFLWHKVYLHRLAGHCLFDVFFRDTQKMKDMVETRVRQSHVGNPIQCLFCIVGNSQTRLGQH